MREHGGFEHNLHGLRILEELEYRYADFPGLNLSFEVRQAQAMHSKAKDAPELQPYRRRPAAAGSPGRGRSRQPGLTRTTSTTP